MTVEQEWWRNKLAEDIYATLRLKEQTLPHFQGVSPQLWIRRHLVDWLSMIVGELDICATAQHLAVYLLDIFMEGLEVELCYLHLVALTCLLLAVKFEEHCEHVPLYSTLNSYVHVNQYNGGQPYTARQFLQMELNILRFTNFELCVPTVPHFLPYFLKVAVDEDDLRDGIPISSKLTVETHLEKHAAYFQEIVLQDPIYRDYPPSQVAASCVAAARICLHLTPTWPKQLELMTDFYLEQLLPCLKAMLGTHQRDSASTTAVGGSLPSQSYLPSISSVQQSYSPLHTQLSKSNPSSQRQTVDSHNPLTHTSYKSCAPSSTSQRTSAFQRYKPYQKSGYLPTNLPREQVIVGTLNPAEFQGPGYSNANVYSNDGAFSHNGANIANSAFRHFGAHDVAVHSSRPCRFKQQSETPEFAALVAPPERKECKPNSNVPATSLSRPTKHSRALV
ncbi:cyclin-J-like [Mya arenaria]|uniref:cyclin-J-like n=1 Tax=Mya arenaria TaxID=6604 RepID=UPI0022E307CA|nr:cyclin-J-like [Mya arenaria]